MVIGAVPEAIDITERRQGEEALRQAQKMEAVGQLTGGVAHDFNNLLQSLTGSLELVLDHVGDRPDALAYGQIALRAARRGGELTHRLLAFSRQQPLAPKSFDANKLVAAMCDEWARASGLMLGERSVSAAAKL